MSESQKPKHRLCTRRKHHQWTYRGPGVTGWSIATCIMCGAVELA